MWTRFKPETKSKNQIMFQCIHFRKRQLIRLPIPSSVKKGTRHSVFFPPMLKKMQNGVKKCCFDIFVCFPIPLTVNNPRRMVTWKNIHYSDNTLQYLTAGL